jgi:dTDP-glucose pyrophosphorylase
MKAVILAAGRGERLQPITTTRPKPMIPLAGKPLLEHNIESLKRAGIKEILLIVGYKEEMIKTYFLDGVDKFNIKINYLSQKEHLGTAHATNLAKEFVSDDEFLLLYGDLLIDPQIFSKIINLFNGRTSNGLITLLRVNNPQDYGIITLNSDGYVLKVTEKPNPSLNLGNLANAGLYIFDSAIFKAIKLTNLSLRKEYELTE